MAIAKLVLNSDTQIVLQDQHGHVVKNEEFTTEYEAPVEPETEEN